MKQKEMQKNQRPKSTLSLNFVMSWVDVLLNVLLMITLLFLLAYKLIQVKQVEAEHASTKATYQIEMTWDNMSEDDIDLWVRDPNDNEVGYLTPHVDFMSLDRDDRGRSTTRTIINGQVAYINYRKEIVSIYQKVPGEYVVNGFEYSKNEPGTVHVTIKLIQVNPYNILAQKTIPFDTNGEEKTFFTFFIRNNGEIYISDTPTFIPLFPRAPN